MDKAKKIKINYLILKILGALLFSTSVVFLIIGICNYGNEYNDFFATFSMSGIPFLFAGVFFLLAGFKPELSKLKAKKRNAEPQSTETELVCKACGKAIDPDSVFCKFCGEKQEN